MMKILLIASFGIAASILQSAFFVRIIPVGLSPDIALVLLLAASSYYGSMTGMISGFFIGLSYDMLSFAPLGFHGFLYTSIGYLAGLSKSNISSGRFVLPILLTLVATVFKYCGAYLLHLVFGQDSSLRQVFSLNIVFETGINILLIPFIFQVFIIAARASDKRRGGL